MSAGAEPNEYLVGALDVADDEGVQDGGSLLHNT